jgi:ketosteroid isomerase-like protein
MNQDAAGLFDQLLKLMMDKNLEGMMDLIHDDAVFVDPHYPMERMEGKKAIRQGLIWGLETLVKPGFEIKKIHASEHSGAVEVATHHVLKGGMEVEFDQVFLFEINDSQLIRLQAFVPYRQPGIGGWIPRITGFWWRITGKA